jgi:hypothetical protein
MSDKFLKEVGGIAEEALEETIRELAEEDAKKKPKAVFEKADPGSAFWYVLLGALIKSRSDFYEFTNSVPTALISMEDIESLKDHVVVVKDDPHARGGFIVTVEKQK